MTSSLCESRGISPLKWGTGFLLKGSNPQYVLYFFPVCTALSPLADFLILALSRGAYVRGGLMHALWSLHLLIWTAIIFYKANLPVVVPDQVLQREEAPAVCPHGDFTGQSQRFGGRLQQGHLVPVSIQQQGQHRIWSFTDRNSAYIV